MQLDLFEPANLALAELQSHLKRLALVDALDCLEKYQSTWGNLNLTWEREFLDFWTTHGIPNDVDEGCELWRELEATPFWPGLRAGSQDDVRLNFFTRLLDVVGVDPAASATRSASGISLGYLCLLAREPEKAARLLERESEEYPDDPEPQLQLGNARLLTGDSYGARVCYRNALLDDLPASEHGDILDPDVRVFLLKQADYPEWAVIEGCILGLFPITCLRSAEAIETFSSVQSWLDPSDSQNAPSPVEQFYACLVVSFNRDLAPEGILMRARMHMKFLHPKLHRLHMESLG